MLPSYIVNISTWNFAGGFRTKFGKYFSFLILDFGFKRNLNKILAYFHGEMFLNCAQIPNKKIEAAMELPILVPNPLAKLQTKFVDFYL